MSYWLWWILLPLLLSVKMFPEVLQVVVLWDLFVCVKYYQLICVFALASVNV